MTGEKANPTRAKNAQVQSAPAEMPGVEEIKELLLRFHADTASAWRHERDGIAAFAASAILALFAPILAEKEREIEAVKQVCEMNATSGAFWAKRSEAAEARALAAEAELARRNAAEEEAAREAFCLHMQERNAREAAEAKCDALREALARAQSWHESEDKALSKSGRSDADYHWRRLQHREQLDAIRGALPESEYEAAWGRMNARYEQETADVGE